MNASSIAQAGGGVKNFAIGAGILVGIVAVFYFGNKIVAGLNKAKEAAEQGTGYLLGTRNDVSLGSTIFDWTHDTGTFVPDPDQQLKTCRALYRDGRPISNTGPCKDLLLTYGFD